MSDQRSPPADGNAVRIEGPSSDAWRLPTAAAALGSLVAAGCAWYSWSAKAPPTPRSDPITVVPGRSPSSVRAPAPPAATASSTGNGSFGDLSLIERQLLVRSAVRDPTREAVVKLRLASQDLQTSGRAIGIEDVIVAGGYCEITGSVALSPRVDQQAVVDGLTSNALRSMLERSGIDDVTEATVNKPGEEMLLFIVHGKNC